MKRPAWAVMALLLAIGATVAHAAESHGTSLKFVKTIGPGRDDGQGWMSFVAFSADGRKIVSDAPSTPNDTSGILTIWSFPKGRLIGRMPGGVQAISKDWKYYADDQSVRELAGGKRVIAGGFANFAFSPDDATVIEQQSHTPLADRGMQLIDLASGKTVRSFGTRAAFSFAISPDGRTLAAGYWDIIVLWDMRSGKRIATLRGFTRYVDSISFRRDGRVLAAGTDWNIVQAWDLRRRKRLFSIGLDGSQPSAPAFSPDGTLLAVGAYGTGTVSLLDARSGRLLDRKRVSGTGCGSAAFSPDGRYLITPSTGGLITWPYDRGGRIKVFKVVHRRSADTRRGEGG